MLGEHRRLLIRLQLKRCFPTTLTDIGYPLLLFTLWEATIAGVIGAKSGVVASTLAHVGAIVLL